uniref:Uncharacterized protein n=1 Tax=Pelagomonas calceolata TaxID=35677 RepID=A0A7S3ZY05_9STRA|mmetsp:Transcript_18996/g.54258  ORF Transcript_18996/g.54258 Transcript_18996/m.54258 type:complete len:125 (+) Transcript_18996:3578-3952(+)
MKKKKRVVPMEIHWLKQARAAVQHTPIPQNRTHRTVRRVSSTRIPFCAEYEYTGKRVGANQYTRSVSRWTRSNIFIMHLHSCSTKTTERISIDDEPVKTTTHKISTMQTLRIAMSDERNRFGGR